MRRRPSRGLAGSVPGSGAALEVGERNAAVTNALHPAQEEIAMPTRKPKKKRGAPNAHTAPSSRRGHRPRLSSCVWRGPAAARGFISPVPRSDDLAQPCAPGDGRQQKPLRSTQDIAVVESDAEEPSERVCRVACSHHMDDQPEFRGRCPSRHRENDRAEGEVDAQKVPGRAELSPLKVSALGGRRKASARGSRNGGNAVAIAPRNRAVSPRPL